MTWSRLGRKEVKLWGRSKNAENGGRRARQKSLEKRRSRNGKPKDARKGGEQQGWDLRAGPYENEKMGNEGKQRKKRKNPEKRTNSPLGILEGRVQGNANGRKREGKHADLERLCKVSSRFRGRKEAVVAK